MNATTTTDTKKPSKAERLASAIEAARARLDELERVVGPKIAIELDKMEELRKARDAASKASSKKYDLFNEARSSTYARLFPGEKVAKLNEQVRAFVTQKGLLSANVESLARDYMGRVLDADPEYTAANKAFRDAQEREQAAWRNWNVATNPGSPLSRMQYQISEAKNALKRLEMELEQLPMKRESQRDTRREQKLEEKRDAETQAARAVMAEFVFVEVA